ncbi:hypothetical protein [Kistimonas scapharcae]
MPDPKLGSAFETAEGRIQSDGAVALQERIIDPNHRQTVQVNWLFTEPQWQVFVSWHRWRLDDGAGWFSVGWDGREGLARFIGNYSCSMDGANRAVTATVEIDYAVS